MSDEAKKTSGLARTLVAEAGHLSLTGHSVSIKIEGPDRAEMNDWKGRVSGRRVGNDQFELVILDAPPRGRKNEENVTVVLKDILSNREGTAVAIEPGVDGRGEDAIVTLNGRKLSVQIVTVPSDQAIGRLVSTGQAKLAFTAETGAQWLIESIDRKLHLPVAVRANTILVLDARHAAILNHREVIARFRSQVPAPAGYGFSELWLVGQSVGTSSRLA